MCFEAVRRYGKLIKEVPVELRTYELCLMAVKRGASLEYVPQELKTMEICAAAVDVFCWKPVFDGFWECEEINDIIELAPEAFRPALYLVVAEKGPHFFFLELIPEKYRTPEVRQAAIRMNREFVPEEMKQQETESYLSGVLQDERTLEFVPERVKMQALKNSIHQKVLNDAYLEWVSNDGMELENVPEYSLTEKICLAAVKQNAKALEFVPDKFKTEAVQLTATKEVPKS